MDQHINAVSLLSGAAAGTSVDFILFPLDTIKTRLQSQHGFLKSGGFNGIYNGLSSAVLGSAPTAALFFITYEKTKVYLHNKKVNPTLSHMIAANLGEIGACLIRVPVEVVKQRAQTRSNMTALQVFRQTLHTEGFKGFYRGYLTTVFREIPFASIQFPLWEMLKELTRKQSKTNDCEPWKAAVCGAIAGGVAAAITTPIDVAKTRIILSQVKFLQDYTFWNILRLFNLKTESSHMKWKIFKTLRDIHAERQLKGLFAGILPRVSMISFGGFIFFGVYEKAKSILIKVF